MFFFFEENFPARLKYLRKSKGFTLEMLGQCVNSTKATLSNFENGNKSPSIDMLIRLADFFDVSIDYLVGRTNNPNIIR